LKTTKPEFFGGKYTMRNVMVVVAAFFLVAALGSAAPLCTNGPINLSTTMLSCSLGGLTFSDFAVISAGGNPSPEVDVRTSLDASGNVTLAFNPNIASPTMTQDIWLFYKVAGGATTVTGTLTGVSAAISEHGCTAAYINFACSGTSLGGFVISSGGAESASLALTGTSAWLFKDINVKTGGGLTLFTQTFPGIPGGGGGGAGGGEVPEPVSFILMGSGLVALSLLRKVRRA
jgi:hypothetical protein